MGNLYKLLGMRPEDNAISPSTSLIELGIDSLVAVDMRFWFTRELDLDLPVLKLLGGATVEDMVEDASIRLASTLIPNVKVHVDEDVVSASETDPPSSDLDGTQGEDTFSDTSSDPSGGSMDGGAGLK